MNLFAARLFAATCLVAAACGGGESQPPAPDAGRCGDGVAADGEDCDGVDLRGRSCADFGLNAGQLTCLPSCVYDLRSCRLAEVCGDGVDNDGDGAVDCADPECAGLASCAACGDGRVSGDEQCEDALDLAGGCCAGCRAAAGCEIEPAGGAPAPLALDGGHASLRGSIAPAGDVDDFAIVVPAGSSGRVRAHLAGATPEASCPAARLELIDPTGALRSAVRVAPSCVGFSVDSLAAGTSLVRVSSTTGGTFAYALAIDVDLAPCGDGVVDPGQECDGGQGCTGCRLDVVSTRGNGALPVAAGPFVPPFAFAGDLADGQPDWVTIRIERQAGVRVDIISPDCEATAAFVQLGDLTPEGFFESLGLAVFLVPPVCAQVSTVAGAGVPVPGGPPGPGPGLGRQLDPGVYYVHVDPMPGVAVGPRPYRAVVTLTSVCGDGVVEETEECDGGAGCDDHCQRVATACGDGHVDEGEECDDGGRLPGDGCDEFCRNEAPASCGDGRRDLDEECDDGNPFDGDCCSHLCTVELGCEVEPNDTAQFATRANGATVLTGNLSPHDGADDVDLFILFADRPMDLAISSGLGCQAPPGLEVSLIYDDASAVADEGGCLRLARTLAEGPHVLAVMNGRQPAAYSLSVTPLSVCGDGMITGTETCDDQTRACVDCAHQAECGDAIVTPPEACDDGNLAGGDGCDATCAVEGGGVCGDRNVDPGEECDDGNLTDGDGCSALCTREPTCGDGVLDPGEGCDDGGRVPGDGCDADCALEPGHVEESEPNDDGSPSVANSDFRPTAANGPFDDDVTIHGAIEPFGDDDVFAVTNRGVVRVTVSAETVGTTCAVIDTELRLRDGSGALLAFDDDGGAGGCSRLTFELDPGATRYVVLTDDGDNSLIAQYALALRFGP